MRKVPISLLFILVVPYWVISQTCGTTPTTDVVRYMKTIDRADTRDLKVAQGILDIPYQLHIVRRTDGTGNISVKEVTQYVQAVNELYLSANLRLVPLGEVNYVDADHFFDFQITDENSLAKSRDVTNALNIYCLNSIEGGYYGYTYHPSKSRASRLFMSVEGFVNGSTFPHELGHFFGLYHTHGKGQELDKRQEPIDRKMDADGNGVIDCYETGDDLCDTPADPNLGLAAFRSYCKKDCSTTAKIPHQSGKVYQPRLDNIMCYNQHSNCRTQFTKEQLTKINQTAKKNGSI